MLAASDLHFAYTARASRRGEPASTAGDVVRGVSVRLSPGRVTALLGPNGAGKSTLLRLLLGTLAPQRGTVTLGDLPLARVPVWERAGAVAYIGQRGALAGPMTVRRVVELGRHAVGARAGAVEGAMGRAGVADLAGRAFETLSAGQQQRVSLARALAQLDGPAGPLGHTLLADEPVSAMDPRHALEALGVMRSLAREGGGGGAAVCVVLHDLTLALRFADEAVLLDSTGAVAAAGPACEVLTPRVLGPVFGVGFEVLAGRAGSAVAVTG